MAVKLPLVISSAGQIQQLQPGDTINTGNVLTVSTPARAFGVVFQPSTSRNVIVAYSVRITSTLTLAVGQQGRVELVSDAANPPTVVRAIVPGGSTGLLALGANIADVAGGVLTFKVPASWFVLIRTVNEVGVPTYAITAQVEELD